MRDDSHKWAPPFDAGARLQSHDVTIATHRFERLTLVSGTAVLTAAELPIVGWPDIAPGGSYAVSLRRDRILEVNGPARADGWDGTMALAISDMTDGYHAFTISGSAAMVFLSRGAPLSIDHSSRSTARLIFGLPGILYRDTQSSFILMVGRAQAAALWHAFKLEFEASGWAARAED